MYLKIDSIPYKKEPVPPLYMTFGLLNGRSYSEPSIFGPYLWFILHTTAASLPDKLTRRQQGSFVTFMHNFPILIPCQVCREHAYAYICKTLPYTKTSTKSELFEYLWTFHNFVNSRVANPRTPLTTAQRQYGYDFSQRSVITNRNTGETTIQPLHSQAGYGFVLTMSLLIAAVYYPERPTKDTQAMMIGVVQNLGWLIPNPQDREKASFYLSSRNVILAVTHRKLLFDLFYRLIQYLFSDRPPFRSLGEAERRVNFNSYGQGRVLAFQLKLR